MLMVGCNLINIKNKRQANSFQFLAPVSASHLWPTVGIAGASFVLVLLFIAGCGGQLQQPPEYFLHNVGEVKLVAKLPPWRLGQTNWDGSILIKNVTPIFTTKEMVLRHEQAHSFEIIAARDRQAEYRRFRTEFDSTYKSKYIEMEAFPKAVIRALKGRKDKGAQVALKFIRGGYRG